MNHPFDRDQILEIVLLEHLWEGSQVVRLLTI
jgi:hypothetical protein